MKRSKSKTIYFKWPSRENLLAYKKKKKKCNTNAKYSEKAYFRKITGKKAVNHLGMQSKPFALIKES